MSTYAKENTLLEEAERLHATGTDKQLPPALKVVGGRLYMPVKGLAVNGYLMVDTATKRVAVVYDLSGGQNHNFWAKDSQIDQMLNLIKMASGWAHHEE